MMLYRKNNIFSAFLLLFTSSVFLFSFSITYAETAEELRGKISERNDNIKQLEAEIKGYQEQIDILGKESDTLKNTLASLDLSNKKLATNLAITENKIAGTNLEIKQLSFQIEDKSSRIVDSRRVVAQSLAAISETEATSILEAILGSSGFADLWNNTEELTRLQTNVVDRIHELEGIKVSLEDNKAKTEQKKMELVSLQNDLANQKKLIIEATKEKNALLAATKNSETNYRKILADREQQKKTFEREIANLESSLKFVLDRNSIPSSGSGVLKWPLDKVRITQYFGNTEFSTKNPNVYGGAGHNGIDIAASIGTTVRASAAGIVSNVIKTHSRSCGYGNWITIRHPNGLTTLYAHLSLTIVSVGTTVDVGQPIGYSGNTGVSTGPHLHFGVYATQGLKTTASKTCPSIIVPYAAYTAQLNPLSYL